MEAPCTAEKLEVSAGCRRAMRFGSVRHGRGKYQKNCGDKSHIRVLSTRVNADE